MKDFTYALMETYNFRIDIEFLGEDASDSDVQDFIEKLGEVGCTDCLPGIGVKNKIALAFSREANSRAEAVSSALADLLDVTIDSSATELEYRSVPGKTSGTSAARAVFKGRAKPMEYNLEEEEKEILGEVLLKSGETVQVPLRELNEFLEQNLDKIAIQHDPEMKKRRVDNSGN